MKTWLKIALGVVVFFFAIVVIIAIFNPSEKTYQTGNVINTGNNQETATRDLKILSSQLEYGDYGNLMVVGTAQNIAGRQLTYAEVRVKFYDKDGNVISTSLDNINDLNSGETWKFQVTYLGMDTYNVDRYDIAVGSTW